MNQTKVLNNVITKAVRDQSLDVLNNYFSTSSNSQVFNKETVLTLLKLLKRETQHENKSLHVEVVISCMEHFLDLECNPSNWEALAEDLSKLCEVIFVISSSFIKDELLIQKSVNVISALLEQNDSLVDNIMRYSLRNMMDAVSLSFSNCTKLEVLTLVGALLQKSSKQVRREVLPSTSRSLEELSNFMLVSGDYETEVAVVEVLARCWILVKDNENCPNLFSNKSTVLEIFNKYKFVNFEAECRLFLNEVNEGLGAGQLVYSFSCMTVYADDTRLKKPNDILYKEFWVDFSLATKAISFYHIPNSEDDWEFMKVLEEQILLGVALNSHCKSKSGEVISAIKLEITLKSDHSTLGLPKVLKIYFRKNKLFQRLEDTVIKEILQNKYKSNATYDDLPKGQSSVIKESLTQQPYTQSNEIQFPSSSYNRLQISISQRKSVSPVANTKASTSLEGNSFYNISALANQSVSHEESKLSDESQNSDVVNPSLSPSTKTMESIKPHQTRSKANPAAPVDHLNVSDSFTQYLIEGRKRNLNKGHCAQETLKNSDSVNTVEDENCCGIDITEKNQLKTKHELGIKENNKLELDKRQEKFGKYDSKSVNISNEVKTISGILSLPLKRCHETNAAPSPVLTTANVLDKSESGQRVCDSSGAIAESNNQKRKSSTPFSNNSSAIKRRLYSFENNKNVKDLVMSSQDDVSLEVPQYKIKKQERRGSPKPGLRRENISYSYITQNQKGKEAIFSNNSKIFSDSYDLEEEIFKEEKTKVAGTEKSLRSTDQASTFKNNAVNDKKLRVLNKTPEGTKESNIFPSHSVYSDLSSPDKKKPVKRTYARPKQQKRFKKIKVLDDSSDSEYTPSCKISPEYVGPREKKTRSKSVKKGFVDQLQNERIDPIRDKTYTDDLEIMCLEGNEIGNKNRTMQVHSMKVATTVMSNVCKAKKKNAMKAENVKKAPKKTVNKKKTTQSKKPEVQIIEDVEEVTNTMALKPLLFGPANFIPQISDIEEDDDFTLDVFNCQNTQNKDLGQTTYKGMEVVKFGSYFLSQVTDKVKEVQSLAHKEREMNFAAFDFKAQSACTALHRLSEKSEAVANQISQAISMLQTAHNIQSENASKIRSEALQLEEAKQDLLANITKIEKTEAGNVASIFQGFGRYIRNIVVSFTRKILLKKALPQPK